LQVKLCDPCLSAFEALCVKMRYTNRRILYFTLLYPYCRAEMYTGRVTCRPLVSHDEYADGTDRWTDGRQRNNRRRCMLRLRIIVSYFPYSHFHTTEDVTWSGVGRSWSWSATSAPPVSTSRRRWTPSSEEARVNLPRRVVSAPTT